MRDVGLHVSWMGHETVQTTKAKGYMYVHQMMYQICGVQLFCLVCPSVNLSRSVLSTVLNCSSNFYDNLRTTVNFLTDRMSYMDNTDTSQRRTVSTSETSWSWLKPWCLYWDESFLLVEYKLIVGRLLSRFRKREEIWRYTTDNAESKEKGRNLTQSYDKRP